MRIRYKCPKCGGNISFTIVATYPETYCYLCLKCGYHKDIQEKLEEKIVIAPE